MVFSKLTNTPMENNKTTVKNHKRRKNIALGAGLGMIFGAALGNVAIGFVLGAGGGLLFESLGKNIPGKSG